MRIVDIDLFTSTTMPHQVDRINITIHSMYIKPVSILCVIINNNHAMDFTAKNEPGRFNYTINYQSLARGYKSSVVNTLNLLSNAGNIFNNEPIHLKIMTSRVNIFSRVFTPPVAIPIVHIESESVAPNKFNNILILDASRSFDPDKDGFIVLPEWSARYTDVETPEIYIIFLHRQKIRPHFINTDMSSINATMRWSMFT